MGLLEEIRVGETDEIGKHHFQEDEIKDFAEEYDPQPFHLDNMAAESSFFGELVASGWHTLMICGKLLNESVTNEGSDEDPIHAGVGIDDMRWKKPVKPGDTIRVITEVVDKRKSESHDNRGYVKQRVKGVNQQDEVVISFTTIGLIEIERGKCDQR